MTFVYLHLYHDVCLSAPVLSSITAHCRTYSPYITAGYLPNDPDGIKQQLLALLADGEAVLRVSGLQVQ
jgi:hypothetical protein